MSRMRLVGWEVRPIVMADDGEELTPVTVNPVQIPIKDWDEFKQGGDEKALAPIRVQIESEGKPPTSITPRKKE